MGWGVVQPPRASDSKGGQKKRQDEYFKRKYHIFYTEIILINKPVLGTFNKYIVLIILIFVISVRV